MFIVILPPGNVLHNHVDRVNTHVISVILQIDQDLGSENVDWLLEVIEYTGERNHIKLLPGEMLFYESSKLIHGRPDAFRGEIFANAFMHFAPVHDWDYEFDVEQKLFMSKSRGIREGMTDIYGDLTRRKQIIRDEL